jgi:hypothetical protein
MKKQILFFLLFLIVAVSSFAQFNTYHPFPDSNAYWKEEQTYMPGNAGSGEEYVDYGYILSGDTNVNGISYHKVYKVGGREWCMFCSPYYFYNYNSMSYAAAIRQDTVMKREYVCCTASLKTDTLLYDFNLKIGDTLNEYNTIGIHERNYVYGIDSVLRDNNYRKALVIATGTGTGRRVMDTIVEGIGSLYGLFEAEVIPFESSTGLMCFWQNGYVVYSPGTNTKNAPYYDSCVEYGLNYHWTGINSVTPENVSFSVFPNPAGKQVTLSYELPQQQTNATLQLYNAVGQLVKTVAVKGYKGSVDNDVSALPNGIYYYTLSVDGVVEATSKLAVIR